MYSPRRDYVGRRDAVVEESLGRRHRVVQGGREGALGGEARSTDTARALARRASWEASPAARVALPRA